VALCFLGLTEYYGRRENLTIALHRARDSYQKDLAYRRWAAERGGVYVPLDARTPPNPYLAHLPNRDITTTDGTRLTLVNPAYMTRMVHELSASDYGLKAHLTSLMPIRPENAPDPWERRALEFFNGGAREYSELVREAGGPVLRYMGAFTVESSCLACHASQGYRVGDIRGGLSITVPVGSGAAALGLSHRGITLLAFLAFWALGGLGLFQWVRKAKDAAREHGRVLAELSESSHRFRRLFESSPAPMFIHREGRILEVNQAAAGLLGASEPAQLLGLEVLTFIHPGFRDLVAERVHSVRTTGTPAPLVEEVFLTLQGEEVPVAVQTASIDLPDGPAILAFAQDLTDRQLNEENRRKLEAEIQHAQKLESLGSLAGGIAHDMNNVLAAILGVASLLQMKREGDEPLLKALQTIENAASRGRDLVKGLTDFARKDLQQAQVLDLNALVRKELDLLVRTSRQRFTFDVQLDEALPPILGEPSTLGSAFMNLCVNAFDAMPHGGRLRIQTYAEDGFACLLVADTGEGIPAPLLHRVTEPFFTTKAPGQGTGLGLAMVYGTMHAHGGSLEIQSEVGLGTRVLLRFPAKEPLAETRPLAPAPAPGSGRPLRVLLVDDDELIRTILPPMLEQLGHQVEVATGGLEALRRLEAGLEVDLVILDHNMPGMTGAETLPRLLLLRPGLPVLVATGFQDLELKRLLLDFPMVQTLSKPFSLEELRRVLQGL
jgi:PAS domain S-box-containing protein